MSETKTKIKAGDKFYDAIGEVKITMVVGNYVMYVRPLRFPSVCSIKLIEITFLTPSE